MTKSTWIAWGTLVAIGCGLPRDYAETAVEPDAGGDRDCPRDLAARIQVTAIEVEADIRYKTPSGLGVRS